MKKLILLAAFMVIAFQGFSQTSLEPTKLGEWNRPAATGIADVDQYIEPARICIRRLWTFASSMKRSTP